MATSRKPHRHPPASAVRRPRRGGGNRADAGQQARFEDVEARAARLGVTAAKVLREYARIAFADLRHILDWDDSGVHVKPALSKTDAAPISEISAGADGKGPVRVKLYDKKAALDAIARHLGMFTPHETPEDVNQSNPAEDPREVLKRELARLAARTAAKQDR